MKHTIPFIVVIWLSPLFFSTVETWPQQNRPQQDTNKPAESRTTTTQTTAAPKGLSARIVRKIAWSEPRSHTEKTWEPPDTSKNIGVIVKMKLERGTGYGTDEFALAYKNLGNEHKSACAGVYDQRKWVIIGDDHVQKTDFYTFDFDGGGWDLLFVIPNDVKEVRLLYKGQPTGNPLTIKQE